MLPWGGVGCCLSAAALYLLGRSSGRDAEALRSVVKVNQLKDLAQLLDTACKVLPLVVTISGRVGSETAIKCERSGLRGVIVEETAEQHFLKHNDAGSWIQDSALMLSMSKEVPWYLDDGTGRVYVVGARAATGLVLTIASEIFEESGRSLVRGTLDYLQGLKMLGVKRVERVLPTAVKDDIGTIRIQQPHKGPFYVSQRILISLLQILGNGQGFTVFGVYLLAKHAVQYILERRRRWDLHKRVLAAAAAKRREQDNEDLCVICLEQEYNAVFVPCGHMCCCTQCSSHLHTCPLCRRRIEQVVGPSATEGRPESPPSQMKKASGMPRGVGFPLYMYAPSPRPRWVEPCRCCATAAAATAPAALPSSGFSLDGASEGGVGNLPMNECMLLPFVGLFLLQKKSYSSCSHGDLQASTLKGRSLFGEKDVLIVPHIRSDLMEICRFQRSLFFFFWCEECFNSSSVERERD
ncbi:unnamed protein product [Spirodela intermedia]|uniref:RING-type E3 ubiquitin transferase n=1 Tax=Spirodela intermedia TaxID=51605 RepID=A0A7I8J2F2_SPIIN|nr:unnamed protein product [Spirodela intermedia]CAA6663561.1 unnamed protein product [Spirodela intermedia]